MRRSRADGAVTLVRWLHAVSGVHGEAFIMWVRMGACSLERLPPPRLSRYLH